MPEDHEVTRLLQAWSKGDIDSLDALVPLVFEDLRRMAGYFFRRESPGSTLQPTALVSEFYLRLRGDRKMHWDSRSDFFNFAAEVMRHILVDRARSRNSQKRGGGATLVNFEWAPDQPIDSDLDVVALHLALQDLETIDPRQSTIVSMRVFVGLTVKEVAEVLGISTATVKREWRTAKFWLHHRLEAPVPAPSVV